jgi:hypothetical protein
MQTYKNKKITNDSYFKPDNLDPKWSLNLVLNSEHQFFRTVHGHPKWGAGSVVLYEAEGRLASYRGGGGVGGV